LSSQVLYALQMNEQERYWAFLVQTYGHTRYLHKYLERCESIDRNISMYTAIASSASIGGWVIWQQAGWVWGTIIAISQVIGAIRKFLPYSTQAEKLRSLDSHYARLLTRIEGEWFRVRSSLLTEAEINDLITRFKTEQDEIEDATFSTVTLPDKKRLLTKAGADTVNHFKSYDG
jgi:hypothetical protein